MGILAFSMIDRYFERWKDRNFTGIYDFALCWALPFFLGCDCLAAVPSHNFSTQPRSNCKCHIPLLLA
jgi:hypothetical protein